jgi:hypothetical protein
MSSYIDELRDVIRRLHGVESEHLKSVPVKEIFRGSIAYAWSHDTVATQTIQSGMSPCYIFRLAQPRSNTAVFLPRRFDQLTR